MRLFRMPGLGRSSRGQPLLARILVEKIEDDGHLSSHANSIRSAYLGAVATEGTTELRGVVAIGEAAEEVAAAFLPELGSVLPEVALVGDRATRELVPSAGVATEEDYATEFLNLKVAVAVVDDLDGAIDHIARFGSGHSEAIITRDLDTATRFTTEVDAAAVLVNASTRFVDGEEFGLGAEIGISTQKLHARGPMGIRALTCVKYIVHGDGQVRS